MLHVIALSPTLSALYLTALFVTVFGLSLAVILTFSKSGRSNDNGH